EVEDIYNEQNPQHRPRLRGRAVGEGRPGPCGKGWLFVHSCLRRRQSRAGSGLSMPRRRHENCRLQLPLRRPSLLAMKFFSSLAALTAAAAILPHVPAAAMAPPLPDIAGKDATTLQAEMTAGSIDSELITSIYLDRILRIDDHGPKLNAVIAIFPDALAEARRLDAERSAGKVRSPLHGVPVLLKDNIEAAGPVPTTAGSLALKDNVTGRDAPLVARL